MADTTDWDDDILNENEADDNIIELTDIVEEENTDFDLDIIEEDTDFDLDIVKEEIDEGEESFDLEDETYFTEEDEFEIDEPIDDMSVDHDQENASPQDLTLSPEQFEAALEKVIEKKFADKIETIMFKVMEKVIEKEITRIKESLQKDLDQG